jgi:hypothetical protein
MMFHFAPRINLSGIVSPRWLGICLLCLTALPVVGARPAFAQALGRQEIHRRLAQRRLQAATVNVLIQREQVLLTRLQTIAFPTLGVVIRIVTLQTSLNQNVSTLQTLNNQIALLDQLLAVLAQIDTVNRKIQTLQTRIGQLQRLGTGFLVLQRIANLQETVQDLQTALAALQGQVDTIQGQLIP